MSYIKIIFLFLFAFLTIYSSNLIATKYPKILNKNNGEIYLAKYIPINEKIVRVEIQIYDDTAKDYFDVIEVTFNNKKIDLLRSDMSGNRGRAYFQLKPGSYSLEWTITTKKASSWPNTQNLQKTITLPDIERFVNITIVGKEATVSY